MPSYTRPEDRSRRHSASLDLGVLCPSLCYRSEAFAEDLPVVAMTHALAPRATQALVARAPVLPAAMAALRAVLLAVLGLLQRQRRSLA
jgi:hypothetical protein